MRAKPEIHLDVFKFYDFINEDHSRKRAGHAAQNYCS